MGIEFIGGSITIGATLGTLSNPAISAVQLYNKWLVLDKNQYDDKFGASLL
jgi:hypothetical protein